MKRFDKSYANFLIKNNDYSSLLRYAKSAYEEGFEDAMYYIDICEKEDGGSNIFNTETSSLPEIETVSSNVRYVVSEDHQNKREVTEREFIQILKKESAREKHSAQYLLAWFYLDGTGVHKNKPKAYELMKASADAGYAKAQHIMAGAYLKGAYFDLECNDKIGLDYLKKAAEQNLPESVWRLGLIYFEGKHGLKKSKKKGIEMISYAAENGDEDALYFLSSVYFHGDGVRKSKKKAIKYCRLAADKGNVNAQYLMWLYFTENCVSLDYDEALTYLEKSANAGLPDANRDLGMEYFNDDDTDYDVAFAYLEYAARKNDAEAQYIIGDCYYCGNGVARNYNEAFRYYKMAAENGHTNAKFWLAWCYDYGEGTPKNPQLAYKWYLAAARDGDKYAINNLGVCYAIGKGTRKNKKKAVYCYKVAAKNGVAEAINSLGTFYETGNVLEKNYDKAVECYQKSSELNCVTAILNLARCYEAGNGVEKNFSKSLELYIKAAVKKPKEYAHELLKLDINKFSAEEAFKLSQRLYSSDWGEKFKKRAFDLLFYAAEKGYDEAEYSLSLKLYWGNRLKKNYLLSYIYCSRAVLKGNKYAIYFLGSMYNEGLGVEPNHEKALQCYLKAAELSVPEAYDYLGKAYEFGKLGVKPDPGKAIEYYKLGAEKGEEGCCNNLATLYAKGKGVRKNKKKAFKLFYRAAKRSTDAKANLATCFEYGIGTEQDYSEAIKIYVSLAEEGDTASIEKLESLAEHICDPEHFCVIGDCYNHGDGVDADEEKAIEYYKKSADMGNVDALIKIAEIHEDTGDLESAIVFYKEAMRKGNKEAIFLAAFYCNILNKFEDANKLFLQDIETGCKNPLSYFYLGHNYYEGNCVDKNIPKAIDLFEKAAELGCDCSMVALSRYYSLEDPEKAFNYLSKAEKRGSIYAKYALGESFEKGNLGQKIDIPRAIEFYLDAAENGYDEAVGKITNFDLVSKADPATMRYIAYHYFGKDAHQEELKLYEIAALAGDRVAMYNYGYGLESSDPPKAVYWYKKSADKGEHYGIYALAKCYEDGHGIEMNFSKAFLLLKKLRNSDLAYALTDLGVLYGKGKGTRKNKKKAMECYLKAAILGDSLAFTNIAWYYENGFAVKKDKELALLLYKYAAENGEKHAIEELERIG